MLPRQFSVLMALLLPWVTAAGCGHAVEPVEPAWYSGPTLSHFSEPATLPTVSPAGSPTTSPAQRDATAYTVWMTDAALVRDRRGIGRAWRVQWGLTMRFTSYLDANGRTVFAATPAVDAGVTVTPLPRADAGPHALRARIEWNDAADTRWDLDAQNKLTVQTYCRAAYVVLTLHGERLLEPGATFANTSLNEAAGLIPFDILVRADGGAYHWRIGREKVWQGATIRPDGPPGRVIPGRS